MSSEKCFYLSVSCNEFVWGFLLSKFHISLNFLGKLINLQTKVFLNSVEPPFVSQDLSKTRIKVAEKIFSQIKI